MTAIEEIKAALESCRDGGHVDGVHHPAYFNRAKVRAALSRLAELEKAEPVAWLPECGSPTVDKAVADGWRKHGGKVIPLYTHPAAAPQVPAMRMLTEGEVLAAIFTNSGHHGNGPDLYKTLVTESGPYSINRLTVFGAMLTEALQARFCEVNGIAAPNPPPANGKE